MERQSDGENQIGEVDGGLTSAVVASDEAAGRWYKIHMYVSDDSGGTVFTIYDQHAEKLLNVPPTSLLPDYFHEDSDFHNYRVVDHFEIDTVPTIKVTTMMQKNVYACITICRVLVKPVGNGNMFHQLKLLYVDVAIPEKKKDVNQRKK
ncbi:hypothetical protein LXL04_018138 [Taraxacum kok-saghyz]